VSPRRVSASAPSRIDLAGGTLDIWPLSVLVPGALTVNVAVELRARVTVEARDDDRVRVLSRDRRRRADRRLPLDPHGVDGPLALLLRLVAAFDPSSGLSVESRAAAPAGAGLGGSSTLGVAAAAALARFTGARLGREPLLRRVMNLETMELGVPTGDQDYRAALHGGLAAYRYGPDGTLREPLPLSEELNRRLVLAYTGQPRSSGFSNWEMYRRFVEGEKRTVRNLQAIARIAGEMADALGQGRLDDAGRLLGEEGKLRYRLAPSVATPALLRADRAALRAGALGTKVCGAGGGGCLVAFAAAGRGEDVGRAMAGAGATLLDAPVARAGVRVRTEE
jgi:D-glycero-alpha-D-manno-heptose-7-phosphate kinase